MTKALCVKNLSHSWGAKRALDGVTFALPRGSFCALLGQNGSGKSTLISVLTGLIRPPRGAVHVAGYDMARAPTAALGKIGVVFQQPTLDLDLSVQANLRYFAALHGIPRRIADNRIVEALARLGMAERGHERLRSLNGGHRRRMEIARALLHRPDLLILDEPTVGLDAGTRAAITEHVHALTKTGLSVLWATHLSDEIRPDDAVILLDKGRIRADGEARTLAREDTIPVWFKRVTGGSSCPA